MSGNLDGFGETAKGLARNPLGIIALFIVLVYAFASLVTGLGQSLAPEERMPLIYFLVFFPVLVLGVFAWLVSCHAGKLYGPGEYRDEGNFVRQLTTVASLAAATARAAGTSGEEAEVSQIVAAVRKASSGGHGRASSLRNHILWVDDRPENNVYEQRAFESAGLSISLALSTDEALRMLEDRRFAAIISDMGRHEGPREGYVLLEAIRRGGDDTPFFIYAGSDRPEHRREAEERGAQGSTNRPQELYESVMRAVTERAGR